MESATVCKQEAAVGATSGDNDELLMASRSSLTRLRELTYKLLHKVQSIGELNFPDIERGVDFYDEVTRFEIELIKQALVRTLGHQRRAARLLNLKVTTLNSKIKHYNIRELVARAVRVKLTIPGWH